MVRPANSVQDGEIMGCKPLEGLRVVCSGLDQKARHQLQERFQSMGAELLPGMDTSTIPDVLIATTVVRSDKYQVRVHNGHTRCACNAAKV